MDISKIDEILLYRRLDEIDGQLQDWHISGYKSNLLMEEQKEIKEELKRRGYLKGR